MALRKNAKLKLLKGVPLFLDLSGRELEEVASVADEIDLRPGKKLTVEGRVGREFFILLEGEAEVRRKGRECRPMREGDFFGEIALVTKRPRTATVVAKTPLRVLVVTDRNFQTLMERHPTIQTKVLQALAERISGDNLSL
jgi:CRP/FNR family transcriptional regulator, cyclic AMP receptor protein